MTPYCVFDATGRIVQFGQIPEADLPNFKTLNGTAMACDSTVNLYSHYVANGELVAYTQPQAALLQAWPGPNFTWSLPSCTWTDNRSLAQAQADAWTAVQAARDALQYGGVTYNGGNFQTDQISQQRIGSAVTLATMATAAGQAWAIEWTLTDNTTMTLNASQMMALGVAVGQLVAGAFSTAAALRVQINAATTPVEALAVVWPSGTSSP
jgi:hypothetical protein